MSKRRMLASAMQRLGILRMLEMYRSKPGIFIINHHRVGDASKARFDREVFSATADDLDMQIKYFKKYLHVVSGDELEDLVSGRTKLKQMHVAITFDDGYLDNYTTAFDVLRANQVGAAFFVVPEYVGTSCIPWWDEIAYLVRNTKKQQIKLKTPGPLALTLTADREAAIHSVLKHYKQPGNTHGAELLEELRAETECALPEPGRRFLNWQEAKEMKSAGMVIGSHTQTHRILGQISPEQQRWELEQSKREIEENIGSPVSTLAYPVGTRGAFDGTTEEIARSLGYTMCFSFYGGVNTAEKMNPTNLLRGGTNPDALLFRTETLMNAKLGRLPY
ncbi:MAG TPA: polysaccharide deacetylase family protein [Edaphobacter sp.]|nr:polysaccharide deacetylase family protein [Edaphobacter sp.]